MLLDAFITWLNYTPPHTSGMQLGALAGIIFLFGVILISRIKVNRWQWIAATILIFLITPLAIGGFWWSEGPLGISDWDYYFSLHTGHRNTLLQFHELPQWNPYICGGTAGLADPEFRFFTPTFLLQLLFGVPAGLRLSTWLMTAVGATGMLLLGKHLKLSVYSALLAATAYGFGGINIIEMVEGHPNIFSAMFIPWIFWAWLKTYRLLSDPNSKPSQRRLWIIITAAFLAETFFQGGIYLLMYTAIAFIGLLFVTPKPIKAALTTLYSGIWALGFAAIKLIPVLLWLSEFQDAHYVSSANFLPYLHLVLLGRLFHGAGDIIPNQASGWHEYGAYLGPVILILAIIGFITHRHRRIPQALFVAAITAILISASGPILKPFFDQVSFIPRSNISRFMLFANIPLALLAGYGIESLVKRHHKLLPVAILLIGLTAVDLMSFAYPLSQQAFVVPRTVYPVAQSEKPLTYNALRYQFNYYTTPEDRKIGRHEQYDRAYEATARGYGTMTYCSVLTPTPAVRTIHDEGPNPLIKIKNNPNPGIIKSWTPNHLTATYSANQDTEITINTNYAIGWYVQIDNQPPQPAKELGNLVGTPVPAGDHHITFFYRTPGITLGTIISILTLLVALYLTVPHKKQSANH